MSTPSPYGRGGAWKPKPERSRSPEGLSNYRLVVEYDGTRYSGSQTQKNARTVAGEIGAALGAVLGRSVTVIVAGRTDAGVHAEGQVMNFLAVPGQDPVTLCVAVNDRLPADINVKECAVVSSDFHARSQALSRHYRYQIATRRSAFHKPFVWWVKESLDLSLLEGEAAAIAGHRDFAAFTDETDVDTMIRVSLSRWSRSGEDRLLFHIAAERFLYKMVRRLVGAMIEVGRGRKPAGLVAGLLAEPRFGVAAEWTAPPSGLFLERVEYGRPPAGRPPARKTRSTGD